MSHSEGRGEQAILNESLMAQTVAALAKDEKFKLICTASSFDKATGKTIGHNTRDTCVFVGRVLGADIAIGLLDLSDDNHAEWISANSRTIDTSGGFGGVAAGKVYDLHNATN